MRRDYFKHSQDSLADRSMSLYKGLFVFLFIIKRNTTTQLLFWLHVVHCCCRWSCVVSILCTLPRFRFPRRQQGYVALSQRQPNPGQAQLLQNEQGWVVACAAIYFTFSPLCDLCNDPVPRTCECVSVGVWPIILFIDYGIARDIFLMPIFYVPSTCNIFIPILCFASGYIILRAYDSSVRVWIVGSN